MTNIPASVDVAIVGGSVAGSCLATVLARTGLGVLLVEREAVFRDRVRGEGIHPWGVAEAATCGLMSTLEAAGANPLPVWQPYVDREPQTAAIWAEDSIDGHPEYGVHHPRLQVASLGAAQTAGATILRPANVVAFRGGSVPEIDVVVSGEVATVRAKLIVGAGGRGTGARRWAGGTTRRDPEHHRIGGGLFRGVDLDPAAAHAAALDGGRVFVLPQGDGRVRAYVVTDPQLRRDVQADRSGERMLRLCASLYPEGTWSRAQPSGPVAFFSNADTWPTRIAGDGIVLIGDAAGANDPSVGQGLSLVFHDVRVLSELLLGGAAWDRAIAEFARRRAAYFDVLRQFAIWFARLVTETGPAADALRAQVTAARERDPSAGGFARIFGRGPEGLIADEAGRRAFFGGAG